MAKITYIQYTNPAAYPPLEHSSRMLADVGWQVLFLGTEANGSRDLTFGDHPNIHTKQFSLAPAGWRQKLHYLLFCGWALWHCLTWRPRYIYASDLWSCPIALCLSYLPGLRVLYHEHDSPPAEGRNTFQKLCLAARRRLAHRTAAGILPNAQRAAVFRRQVADREVHCVWNCPSTQEVELERPLPKKERFVVFYHGSIVPERLPLAVVDALSKLPDHVCLEVAGYETAGSRGHVERMRARARELHVAHRFEYRGAIPQRRDLLKICAQADLGLALMPLESSDINLRHMTGASNKPFDYLANGLPLVVSCLEDWEQMFVKPGFARSCNPHDADSIAQAIAWFVERPEETAAIGRHGREKVLRDWNYETEFEPVFKLLSRSA